MKTREEHLLELTTYALNGAENLLDSIKDDLQAYVEGNSTFKFTDLIESIDQSQMARQAKDTWGKGWEEDNTKRSIVWSVDDFKHLAMQNPDIEYDKEEFEGALEAMIENHDCDYGITWQTVQYYLDSHC